MSALADQLDSANNPLLAESCHPPPGGFGLIPVVEVEGNAALKRRYGVTGKNLKHLFKLWTG